jgi:hypothetical protein
MCPLAPAAGVANLDHSTTQRSGLVLMVARGSITFKRPGLADGIAVFKRGVGALCICWHKVGNRLLYDQRPSTPRTLPSIVGSELGGSEP